MKRITFLIAFIFFVVNIFAQQIGTLIDIRDNQIYKTIKINDQVWMAENLNYDTGAGCWCYDNDTNNCTKYGKLYDMEIALNVCPSGWHLPSSKEFETLMKYLGKEIKAFIQMKEGGASGFNALFSGMRHDDGNFYYIGKYASFWTSTKEKRYNGSREYCYMLKDGKVISISTHYSNNGFSVRCLKD